MFYSTRNKEHLVSASKAIVNGLAPDNGLYLPKEIIKFNINNDVLSLTYNELATKILSFYLDDFDLNEIKECVDKAYNNKNFPNKIIGIKSFNNYSFLELFYGPTITFKDMALTLLPHLLSKAIEKQQIKKKVMILTATSGDTGSAALSGFSNTNIETNILYPKDGISPIQEKQMLFFTSSSCRAYSLINSNFDDCQNAVKDIIHNGNEEYLLTSANSINIGRLLPQIVYYYASYIELVKSNQIKLNQKINVIVPTGNFGNIFACYLAKEMGLPINKLICASNENKVLTDLFNNGIYSIKREFKKTNSPSMDILISSNFERLLALMSDSTDELNNYMSSLKENKEYKVSSKVKEKLDSLFESYSIDSNKTIENIKECYKNNDYLIDPHTAVAYGAYKNKKSDDTYTLIVSTASPFKFSETIASALNISKGNNEITCLNNIVEQTKLSLPIQLEKVLNSTFEPYEINLNEFKHEVFTKKKFYVEAPATSANLGPGFDIVGVAWNLFNEFKFEVNDKDELFNFNEYNDLDNNLVLKSYRYLFKKLDKPYQPISITNIANYPIARGLGSSSSCIVGGLLAANKVLRNILSKKQLLKYAIELEGHPDNVVPCMLGGFVSTIKTNKDYIFNKYDINKKLVFILCIPEQELSTEYCRKVLPSTLSYSDIIYSASRLMNLPRALKDGNLDSIQECLNDKLHTPYRLKLIKDSEKIQEIARRNNLPFAISGSGSTMLVISNSTNILKEFEKENYVVPYSFIEVTLNIDGACIKEEK